MDNNDILIEKYNNHIILKRLELDDKYDIKIILFEYIYIVIKDEIMIYNFQEVIIYYGKKMKTILHSACYSKDVIINIKRLNKLANQPISSQLMAKKDRPWQKQQKPPSKQRTREQPLRLRTGVK